MALDAQVDGNYFAANPLTAIEIERGERLLYRLTEFGRILWESGIDVGPRKMLDLAETLDYVDITNKEDFYNTLKCSLLVRHEQEPLFNQLYFYYWYMRDRKDKKGENMNGAAKREERQFRLPPSERKRLAEHMNNEQVQRKDLRAEMRQSERRAATMIASTTRTMMIPRRRREQPTVPSRCCERKISSPSPGKRCRRRSG